PAVARAFGARDPGHHPASLDRRLHLAGTGDDLPRLPGHRQRRQQPFGQALPRQGTQILRHPDGLLEAACEGLLAYGLRHCLIPEADPDTTALGLRVRIWHHLALPRHHEPDAITSGLHLAGECAHPAGLFAPRHGQEARLRGRPFRQPFLGHRKVVLGDPAGLQAGLQDHLLGFLTGDREVLEGALETLDFTVLAFDPADEIVTGATGKVLDGLDLLLTQRHQHGGSEAGDLVELVLDAKRLALFVLLALDGRQVFGGAVLDLRRRLVVEAWMEAISETSI